jgi:uncharacterized protein YggE
MRLIALAPFAIAAAFAMPALAEDDSTMVMTGHGEVTAAPDTAVITSGVTTEGETARDALDANTKAMSQLIETLKAANIETRDIQTSNFSVNPNYVYSDERDANGYTKPPKIMGYQVSNTVTVRVRDLPALGTILDKAVSVGANTVNNIAFSVADPSKLYDEARKAAFADARDKADLYAEAAGVSLDRILNISEQQNFNQPPRPYAMKTMAQDMAAAAPVPVQAGELTFAIDVAVTWDLGNGK